MSLGTRPLGFASSRPRTVPGTIMPLLPGAIIFRVSRVIITHRVMERKHSFPSSS